MEALRRQTVKPEFWELILVDNASEEPLQLERDLAWHPNGRIVREKELGVTPARLRGIEESRADLLIFVDDDNVVAEDYIAVAGEIAAGRSYIGAFSGSMVAEFEIPPAPSVFPYTSVLAINETDRDYWSNLIGWNKAMPFGAGLCVRRSVATYYSARVNADPRRKALGRSGSGLAACEDIDLAWCSMDLGMGTGRFCRLKLTHLITKSRLSPEYLIKLHAGIAGSQVILASFWGCSILGQDPQSPTEPAWLEFGRFLLRLARLSGIEKDIFLAERKARREAALLVKRLIHESKSLVENSVDDRILP